LLKLNIIFTYAYEMVPTVRPMLLKIKTNATIAKIMPRLLAKRAPTEDTLLQCGQRARALW